MWITSTPVNPTGIYPHISDHRDIQIVYNTGRHRASDGLFVTRSATVGQVCRSGLMMVNMLSIFRFLTLGLTPGSKVSKMGDNLLFNQIYHPTKFQPDSANGVPDMRYHFFLLSGLGGLYMGKSSPIREMNCWTPSSTILPNFIILPTQQLSVSLGYILS